MLAFISTPIGELASPSAIDCKGGFFISHGGAPCQEIYKHRGALRGTSRFGFAGVSNAPNIEVGLFKHKERARVLVFVDVRTERTE